MVIKFATFSKRENSTAVYAGTWTDKTCYLKESCSIITPVIELQKDASILAFNYAYIADFGRYYFVYDIVCDAECMTVYLKCDVLATYKSTIGASSEYILRSASDYNLDVVDTLYPSLADTIFDVGSSSTDTFNSNNISYVIGILNNTKTAKIGATKYYVLNETELGDLMDFLLGTNILTDTQTFIQGLSTEIQNGVARSLMNPTDFIVESFALPYTYDLGQQETLTIGWWSTPVTGYPVDFTAFNKTINSGSLTIPAHPQAQTRGDYLNLNPYTRYWLYLGVFGIVPLDSLQCVDVNQIDYRIYGDPFGNVKCELVCGGAIIDVLSANVKCNFPIGQVSVDALGGASAMISNLMSGSIEAVDGEILPEEYSQGKINGAMGIMSATKAMLPQAKITGSTGTFLDVFSSFISYAEYHTVVDDDVTHRGRPLCEVRTINTLSGYVLVSDADISISGTKEENEQIKRYMNTGFYYE